MTTLTSFPTLGDLLIEEYSPMYCREVTILINPTALAYVAEVGTPLVLATGTLILDSEEATADALLLERVELASEQETTKTYPVLVRGPAVVNKSKIVVTDSAGDTMDIAALVAALLVIGVVARLEPTVYSVQTN